MGTFCEAVTDAAIAAMVPDMEATVHEWIGNDRFEFVDAPFKIGLATTCCGNGYAEILRTTLL